MSSTLVNIETMMTTGKVYGLTPPSVISAPAAVEPPAPTPVPEPPSVPTPEPEPVPETVVAQTAAPVEVVIDQAAPVAPISEVVEKPVGKTSKQKLVES